jgi:uncharacterized hydrophobic protein (TIGR00271 family)
MINLEIFGRAAPMSELADVLDASDGVSRVRLVGARRPGHAVVSASVRPQDIDAVLAELRHRRVPEADITLTHLDVVGATASEATQPSLVWAELVGSARLAARPAGRYVALMVTAGVIASYGVIDDNGILIVGAMAVSPDLLPIAGVATGLAGRQLRLAGRAALTLGIGMAVVSIVAAVSALLQDQLGLLPSGFSLGATAVLGSLTTVNDETIVVAFVAGVAGMLALETRASAAVGVAISVTTVPAAAYLGVGAGLGESAKAIGALGVLGANIAMMILGAVGTLLLQSTLTRRTDAHVLTSPDGAGRSGAAAPHDE